MKKLLILFILLVIVACAVLFWWKNGMNPVDPGNNAKKAFTVQANENLRDVGYALKKADLIRDPIVFFLLIKKEGLDGKIQAGDFQLSPSMSALEIAQALTHGVIQGIKVTIPEGDRATEVAEILRLKVPTYASSWKDNLASEEGFLFPDTYSIPKDADINLIVKIMNDNFEKKYLQASANKTTKLTRSQIVILASIIQREGKTPDDMKLVASVLQNRLDAGIALQTDASIQYALGYQPAEHSWWKKTITADDLKINSLYNTYINPGLPPAPISNPGLYALQAAMNPPSTNYLYYVSDNTGKLHFAKTLDEHNANIRKYAQQ